jgi:NADH-quinone oxidoreductase subunit N
MIDQLLILSNEWLLVLLAFAVVSISLLPGRPASGRGEVVLSALGLSALALASAFGWFPAGSAFGDMYVAGPVENVFKTVFLLAGALTTLLSWPSAAPVDVLPRDRIGEHLGLIILSIIGMCFLVCARELILLYVSVELATIPLILLVAFNRHELRSAEAGMKYVLFSALASGLMLYGFSLLYGATGTTVLSAIAAGLTYSTLALVALALVTAGVGFKIAAVPFHLWTPDTYEGAPAQVTAFLSVASKAAGFGLFYKAIVQVFVPLHVPVLHLVIILSVLTMTVGNLVALFQTNMKRFLAFSSIAQAGYVLLGLTHDGALGLSSVIYYLLVYMVSNLAAFGVVILVAAQTGKEDMRDYVGMSRSNPGLSAVMMLAVFSLAGIPPLAGFLGKFYLFAAAAEVRLYWLVFVAVVNATISLYYYLTVLRWMYLVKAEPGQAVIGHVPVPWAGRIGLVIAVAGMVLIGVVPHVIAWTEAAAARGF